METYTAGTVEFSESPMTDTDFDNFYPYEYVHLIQSYSNNDAEPQSFPLGTPLSIGCSSSTINVGDPVELSYRDMDHNLHKLQATYIGYYAPSEGAAGNACPLFHGNDGYYYFASSTFHYPAGDEFTITPAAFTEQDLQPFPPAGTDDDDTIAGAEGNDLIKAAGGNDTVRAAGGDDQIKGGDGNDVLRGGTGDDVIYGRQDDDRLVGGRGDDTLIGGGGDDTFVFRAAGDLGDAAGATDTITDFHQGDRIDLRHVEAGAETRGLELGENLTVALHKHTTLVSGDLDGDGKADFVIELAGRHHLGDSDFLL